MTDGTPGYDEHGRLRRYTDAVSTVTEYTYVPASPTDTRDGYIERTVVDPEGLAITTEFEVDALGRVTATHFPRSAGVTDGRFVKRVAYNELNQVVEEVSSKPFEFRTRRFYDENGRLQRQERDARDRSGSTMPDGPEVRAYEYDDEFNLTQEATGGADPVNHLVTRHCYDAAGQRILTLQPRGNRTRYRYDERRLVTAKTVGAGTEDASTTRAEYDGDGRLRRKRDARGNAVALVLDALGRIVEEENAIGSIVRRTYNKLDTLTAERVFERRSDGYYLLSRHTSEYDELGRAIRTLTDRFVQPTGPVSREQVASAFLTGPVPGATRLETLSFYNEQGRVTRNVDPLLREHTYEYDALGRPRVETDALGNRILTRYDEHGNVTRRDLIDLVRDPNSGTVTGQRVFSTVFTFDEVDRMASRTDSLGNTTLYHYDSRNNPVLVVDALGNENATEYDIHNRPVREVRRITATGLGDGPVAATVERRFEYDANGNLEATIDALERRTEHGYDALDRRRSTRYADKSEFVADYDPDGNLVRTTDARGLRRYYTVDEVGRTTAVAVDTSGATDVVGGAMFERFAYDGLDRRLLEENDFARCVFEFDSLSRPVRETMTFRSGLATLIGPFVLDRTFDDVGHLTELTYPNGRQLRFDRDPLGQLTGVHSVARGADYPGRAETPDEHEIVRFEYAGRQRIRRINGNGTVTEYAHDGAGRVVEIAHARSGVSLLTIQYLFDAVGNPRTRSDTEAAGTTAESFAYDSLYRLVNLDRPTRAPFDPASLAPATEPSPDPIPVRQAAIDALIGPMAIPAEPPTYAYDLVGNRNVTREGSEVGYRSNELDQYTRLSDLDGDSVVDLGYDVTGNLVRGDGRSYTYDSINRLVSVEQSGSPVAQFVHDVRGRRILEFIDGVAHQLVYDADNLVAEYRDQRLIAQYVYDDGVDRPLQIVARTDAGADGSENWYHVDVVGSTRLLTDHTASITAAYSYAPFGGSTSTPAAPPYNRLLYTGRRLDERLGTYDYRSRQYDPALGRFQQRDPAGPVNGTNLYTYAVNAPLGTVDPYGTEARSDRDSPARAEIEAYFDIQQEHLDKVAKKYAESEHSRQAFDVYRDILDDVEAAALNGRPIDLNGLWEKARRYDWSWPHRSWMHIGRGGDTFAEYGPFGGSEVAGVDLVTVFDAVIGDRVPNPSLTLRIIWQLADVGVALPMLIGPGGAVRGAVGTGVRVSTRASMVAPRTAAAAMRGALEATPAEALAALRAEALPGRRVWLVGPRGGPSTRGLRIAGNRITYDTIAPAGTRQVRNDMVALSNMLGRRGDGFVRQGRWWSGTHGTPNGQFGGLQLHPQYFYHDKVKGHMYGWQVENVAEHPPLTMLREGLEAPSVYAWCYSSSCFLP